MWLHKLLTIKALPKGFHLITHDIIQAVPEIGQIECGLMHVFLKHTSASLTINENADPTVRADLDRYFDQSVPENESYYQHTYEGADDMPAHIKSSLLGVSVSVPIHKGKLALGTWQGIYLAEHRNHGGDRLLVVTLCGQIGSSSRHE